MTMPADESVEEFAAAGAGGVCCGGARLSRIIWSGGWRSVSGARGWRMAVVPVCRFCGGGGGDAASIGVGMWWVRGVVVGEMLPVVAAATVVTAAEPKAAVVFVLWSRSSRRRN